MDINLSKRQCADFIQNSTKSPTGQIMHINPMTQRNIIKNGQVFKKIKKYCDEQFFDEENSHKEVDSFIRNPEVDPITQKPLEVRLSVVDRYARLYSLAYTYNQFDSNDKERKSSEIVKRLPKNHILFKKLDILHYREDRKSFYKDDDVYRYIGDAFRNTFDFDHRGSKYPIGLHSNLAYNEKLILFFNVRIIAEALATYTYIMVSYIVNKQDVHNDVLLNHTYSQIRYVLEFNKLFHTYQEFIELFNRIGKKEFEHAVHSNVKSYLTYISMHNALLKDSKNIVQTVLDMYQELKNISTSKYIPIIQAAFKKSSKKSLV
jgi:hypothetical protein